MEAKYFGLYKNSTLFFTPGGNFASNAWIARNGQDIGDVSGTTFEAYTADDGGYYNLGTNNISPITEEQLKEKLETADPIFKLVLELYEKKRKLKLTEMMNWHMYMSNLKGLIAELGFDKVREEMLKMFCE